MKTVFYFKARALREIRKLNIRDDVLINQWYLDKQPSCYIHYEDEKPVSFALLSKMNFDPFNKHSNPKTLNYIYRLEAHRRKGHATALVDHVKEREQFSAFCSNETSENLFKKCKCKNYGEMYCNVMYRYP
jgi:Acetyltransferase (GNAT) family.